MRVRGLGTCVTITLSGCSLLTSFSELTTSSGPLDGAAPAADAQATDAGVVIASDGSPTSGDGGSSGTTLLVAGGYTSMGTFISDAWTSVINADGSLSAWQSVTPLPHHCARGDVARGPGRSYFIGGNDDSDSPSKTAFLPTLGAAGLSWTPQTPLAVARWRESATYANGFVFAFGGVNYVDGDLSSVEVAGVGSDGTLTAWQTTTPLPAKLAGAPAAAVMGQVVVVAGTTPSTMASTATVLVASQAADGSLGPWMATTALPRADSFGKLVSFGSRIYYLPGYAAGPPLFADVSPGSVGPWTAAPALPAALTEVETIVIGSTLYVLGGRDANGVTDHVYYASIAADGALGAWTAGTALPVARSFVHAAAL